MESEAEILSRYHDSPWLNAILAEQDEFRRGFMIAALGVGLIGPIAVGIESIRLAEWANLPILAAVEAALAQGLRCSQRRSPGRIRRVARFILLFYPIAYLSAVLSPWSHGVHTIVFMAMPPLMDALSPPTRRNRWFLYALAFVLAAALAPLLGIDNAWTRYYTPQRMLVEHAAFGVIAMLSWVVGRQRSRHLLKVAGDVLYDQASRLPSLVSFREDATRASSSIVCIVAIRNFSELSSLFGYALAEDILKLTAARLERAAQALGGKAYRLHGRDFGFLAPCPRAPIDAQARQTLSEALLAHLGGPMSWHGRDIELTYAIGHTLLSGGDAERALSEADAALKRLAPGSAGACGYEPSDEGRSLAEASIASLITLSRNVAEGSFEVYYQQIVELESGKSAWYEALLRIRGDDGRLEAPAPFLKVASSTGHWAPIADFVLARASARAGSGAGPVAINVAFRDLERRAYLEAAIAASTRARAAGSAMIFEILESELGTATERLGEAIGRLRAAGALVAIDDFGAGYSNFGRLLSCPADIVKIDGTLVAHVAEDPAARTMIAGLASICERLGIATVAEFVESEEQALILRDSGIRYGQGFWWMRPGPPEWLPPATPTRLPQRSACS